MIYCICSNIEIAWSNGDGWNGGLALDFLCLQRKLTFCFETASLLQAV